MAYTDLANCKVYLNISTGTTGDDSLITNLITRSQAQIEAYCKRTFETSTGSRYYQEESIQTVPIGSQWRPAGSRYTGNARYSWDVAVGANVDYGAIGHTVLWLDKDLRSIDTLTNGDGTTITSTEYWLEPRNDPPYQWIRLRSNAAWTFDTDGEVTITGSWGYSTTAPADIVHATERLVAYHYRRRDVSEFAVTATNELGIITAPPGVPADVQAILDEGGYVRRIRAR